jgi:hypothetical protein
MVLKKYAIEPESVLHRWRSMFIQGAGLFFGIGIFPQLASDNIGI